MVRGVYKREDGSWYYVVEAEVSCLGCRYLYEEKKVNWRECKFPVDRDFVGQECKFDKQIYLPNWVVEAAKIEAEGDEEAWDYLTEEQHKSDVWKLPCIDEAINLLVKKFKEVVNE